MEMVGVAAAQVEAAVEDLENQLETIREQMVELKVDLYARFGKSINLET